MPLHILHACGAMMLSGFSQKALVDCTVVLQARKPSEQTWVLADCCVCMLPLCVVW
jgi:hypothetical protein